MTHGDFQKQMCVCVCVGGGFFGLKVWRWWRGDSESSYYWGI